MINFKVLVIIYIKISFIFGYYYRAFVLIFYLSYTLYNLYNYQYDKQSDDGSMHFLFYIHIYIYNNKKINFIGEDLNLCFKMLRFCFALLGSGRVIFCAYIYAHPF